MDAQGSDVRVMQQLRCADEERQEMVIVQPPHAVRAGGLEVVRALDSPHQGDVSREDEEGESGEGGGWKEGETVQAEEPDDEVEFMAGPVVDAGAVAEGIVEVGRGFCYGGLVGEPERRVPWGALG